MKKDIADGENNEKFDLKNTSKMPILYEKYKGPEVSKKYIDALYRELDLNCKYKEAGHKWKYFCKSIY